MNLLLAAFTWDPGMRGLLTVVVGTLVLGGSVWLLVATNTGWRLGFQLALTALAGWMLIMTFTWAIYGIGYKGRGGVWKVQEVNYGNLDAAATPGVDQIPDFESLPDQAELRTIIDSHEILKSQFPIDPTRKAPQLGDLLSVDPELKNDAQVKKLIEKDGWKLLPSADKQNGEAAAAATTYLSTERHIVALSTDVVQLDAWDKGGKPDLAEDAGLIDRALFKVKRIVAYPTGNPDHHVVVRVRQIIPTETAVGAPPPTPQADPDQPVISVVLIRDIGSTRLPSIVGIFFWTIVFGACCVSLHHRDKLVREAREAAVAAGA